MAAPRVCYLLKRFPRLSQTFVLNEILELERQGVDVVVVARSPSGEDGRNPRLDLLRAPVRHMGDRATPDEIADAVAELRPDHVHAHFATWGAAAALAVHRRTGIPYSFTAHATDIYRAGLDPGALVDRLASAAFVVTVSDANVAHLTDLLDAGGRAGRIVRIYNGLDLEAVPRSDAPREAGLVASVGRMVEKKGFPDLIAAMDHAGPGARLVIAGDGPDRAALEALVARLGLGERVSMPGAVTPDEALALIARAEVFALPCVVGADGDRDALPTVLLEAMALGTPCVSTPVNGVPEMLADGACGVLVPQRAPDRLGTAIGELLADAARRRRLADAAHEWMRYRFDIRRNVARLAELFAER